MYMYMDDVVNVKTIFFSASLDFLNKRTQLGCLNVRKQAKSKMRTVKAFPSEYLNPLILIPFLAKEVATLAFGIAVLSVYVVIIGSSIPFYIYRYILSKLSDYLNKDLGKMVTARGQFLAIEDFTSKLKAPRSNLIACLTIEGHLSVKEIREVLQKYLVEAKDDNGALKYPEVKQFVTSYLGYKFWEDDKQFKIENHVKAWSPKGTNESDTFSYDQVDELIEDQVNASFTPRRSPWEMLVIPNYSNPELSDSLMTLLVLRMHHCLGDGYGATFAFVSALCSVTPAIPKAEFVRRGNLRLLLFGITYPFRVLREISHFIVMSFRDNPWKVRDDRKMWRQLYKNSAIMSVQQIKDIKNRFGVSFTSVVHAIISSAMEKLLSEKYGMQKAWSLTKMPCIVMLPLKGHPLKMRNYCTGVFINLPTKQMESIERLQKCEMDLVSAKKSTMPMLGQFLPVIGGSLPEYFAEVIGKNRAFPVSLSNFPLGSNEYEICGRRVLNFICAAGPAAGVCGLGVLIYTYGDNLQISFTGEKAAFSKDDLNALAMAAEKEFHDLSRLVFV